MITLTGEQLNWLFDGCDVWRMKPREAPNFSVISYGVEPHSYLSLQFAQLPYAKDHPGLRVAAAVERERHRIADAMERGKMRETRVEETVNSTYFGLLAEFGEANAPPDKVSVAP